MINRLFQKLTVSHESITNTSEQLLELGQEGTEKIEEIIDIWLDSI